jgi:hypothetical protein
MTLVVIVHWGDAFSGIFWEQKGRPPASKVNEGIVCIALSITISLMYMSPSGALSSEQRPREALEKPMAL